MEIIEKVVEHTQNKLEGSSSNAALKLGYDENAGFKSDTFDYVYNSSALIHLRNQKSNIHRTLGHVFGILKPGGRLFVTFTRSDSQYYEKSIKIDQNRIICKEPFDKKREEQLYWLHNSKR